ncbi:MAG: hypothetical protein RI947_1236 [Candidatus Parcubacteria bacterium]|jgi:D-alanine-D-alanine ligase
MKNNKRNEELRDKTLLVINTGSIKKKFVLQRLRKLGLRIIMLNKEKNWAAPLVDEWIFADTTNHDESLRAITAFITANPEMKPDGAITFWEDDVLLTSKIVDKFDFIGIPFRIAKKARNKYLFREFCAANGIVAPRHKLVRSVRDIRLAMEAFKFPMVIKPAYGASSAYVIKVENKEEIMDSFEYMRKNMSANTESSLSDGLDILVEEYIDGDEVDVDILLQNGKVKFYSISDNYKTKEPFFVETGQSIPSSLPVKSQQDLIALAEETLEKMGVQNGCVHFEAKSTKYGPVPIEVNLRMGGDEVYSFIKGAWDVDLIENASKIACGIYIDKIDRPEVPKKYITGQYFLSDQSGVLVTSDVNEKIKKKAYLEELHVYKQIGDALLVPPEGYEYLGWLTVSGDNLLDSQDNLREALKYISYSVVKFDTTSALGKTSRKNRFSSAVLNKDILMRRAKLEHIRQFSPDNMQNLHIGVLGNPKSELYESGSDHLFPGKNIEKVLLKRGYKVTYFDVGDMPRVISELKSSDVDLVLNMCNQVDNDVAVRAQAAGVLDVLQVPYTGSSPLTLSLCMDKIKVKKLLNYHNIPTPKWDYAYTMEDEIRNDLKYPLIVKPGDTDNSIGITNESVVTNKEQLERQVRRIIVEMGRPALIEEYIEGDEYDVCILGSDENDFQVLPLSRSIFKNMPEGYWHIYTQESKLMESELKKNIQIQRPAKNINKKLESLITEIALDTYAILDCLDYGRIEIRVDKDNNPYVLELNPNPSLEPKSCMTEVAKLIHMNYGDLIEEIINTAIQRYKEEAPLLVQSVTHER